MSENIWFHNDVSISAKNISRTIVQTTGALIPSMKPKKGNKMLLFEAPILSRIGLMPPPSSADCARSPYQGIVMDIAIYIKYELIL
jgi:hypothetical protein